MYHHDSISGRGGCFLYVPSHLLSIMYIWWRVGVEELTFTLNGGVLARNCLSTHKERLGTLLLQFIYPNGRRTECCRLGSLSRKLRGFRRTAQTLVLKSWRTVYIRLHCCRRCECPRRHAQGLVTLHNRCTNCGGGGGFCSWFLLFCFFS